MERLTKKYENTNWYDYKSQIKTEQIIDKLGKLEDIMEKYDIESIEELEVLVDTNQYETENIYKIVELEKQIKVLEKENIELKEDYEHCNNLRKLEVEINRNYHTKKYNLDKPVEQLRKIKIPAEMKDYYYKGFDNAERQFASHIADLTMRIKVLEKALELACEPRDDWGGREYDIAKYDNYYDYFIEQAKKELGIK